MPYNQSNIFEHEAFEVGEIELTTPLRFHEKIFVLPELDYGDYSKEEIRYEIKY